MNQELDAQFYANEKLAAAVRVLATHPEEVRLRLRAAAEHLALARLGSLPNDMRTRFSDIWAALTRFQPPPGDSRTAFSITLHKIRKATAAKIAAEIFDLQSELESRLTSNPSSAGSLIPAPRA